MLSKLDKKRIKFDQSYRDGLAEQEKESIPMKAIFSFLNSSFGLRLFSATQRLHIKFLLFTKN